MIFWDQFKDKIEDDQEDNKPEDDSSKKEPDNDDKKEETVKKPSNDSAPPKKMAKPTTGVSSANRKPKTIDAEFEEKSETSLPPSSPTLPAVPATREAESAPEPKTATSKFGGIFGRGKGPSGPGGGDGNDGDGQDDKKKKKTTLNWQEDSFESVITQRNILFFFTIICVLTIAMSVMLIRYVKSTQTIEPFVIEIEQKSGVPTVVTPISTRVYSSDEAIKRYFIMKYIRAREEYFPSTFQENFFNVARVLSTPAVYYNDYRPKFSISNPNSPYNIFGESSNRRVVLKSLIFQSPKTAQVRIAFEVAGIINLRQDKIILMDFDFANIEMNDDERFINPLGFQVTFYRIEDESS